MTVQVSVHQAKTHLSRLLAQVAMGEEVVIAKGGHLVARLVPAYGVSCRTPGSAKGKIIISDYFDQPLPEDILDDFEK